MSILKSQEYLLTQGDSYNLQCEMLPYPRSSVLPLDGRA